MDHCPPAAGDHTAFALQARAAETRIDSAAGCSLQKGEKGVPSIGLEQVCVLSSTINAATLRRKRATGARTRVAAVMSSPLVCRRGHCQLPVANPSRVKP